MTRLVFLFLFIILLALDAEVAVEIALFVLLALPHHFQEVFDVGCVRFLRGFAHVSKM